MKTVLIGIFGLALAACSAVAEDGNEGGNETADAGGLVCVRKCGSFLDWNRRGMVHEFCAPFCEEPNAPECVDRCLADSVTTDGGAPQIVCARFCGTEVIR